MTDELEIMKAIISFQFAKSAALRAEKLESYKLWHAEKALEKKQKAQDSEEKTQEALAFAKNKHAVAKKAKQTASKACADAYLEWAEAKEARAEFEAKTFELLKALEGLNVNLPLKSLEEGGLSSEEILRLILETSND